MRPLLVSITATSSGLPTDFLALAAPAAKADPAARIPTDAATAIHNPLPVPNIEPPCRCAVPMAQPAIPIDRTSLNVRPRRSGSPSIPPFLRLQQLHDTPLPLQLAAGRLGVGRVDDGGLEHRDRLVVLPQLVERLSPAEPQAGVGAVVPQPLARRV